MTSIYKKGHVWDSANDSERCAHSFIGWVSGESGEAVYREKRSRFSLFSREKHKKTGLCHGSPKRMIKRGR